MDYGAFQRADINIKLNGNESFADLSQMSYSIIEFDSIFQFYPKMKLIISDYESVMNEYLVFVNGSQLDVSFGVNKETSKNCKFIVAKNSIPQQKTSSNGVGGDYEVELIHDYFSKQYKSSKAYNSNISDIVKNIVQEYEFSGIDIEDTLNSGYWYQPFVTNSEFINNFLLPFAFSSFSNKTPFYSFIDSNNVFHFKSFNSMFKSTPLKELTYGTKGLNIISDENNISSINFSQLEFSKIKPFFNCMYCNYDKNGEILIENDILTDYTITEGKYPVIGNSNEVSKLQYLYDYDINQEDTKNNNKGLMINSHKESILPDKIIINTMLNKSLVCGNTIKVNLPSTKSNCDTEKSLKNSGIYLIESSYHIWDSKNARSTLVCSKQNLKLTNDYRNSNLLFE